jgi:hypothetical protein
LQTPLDNVDEHVIIVPEQAGFHFLPLQPLKAFFACLRFVFGTVQVPEWITTVFHRDAHHAPAAKAIEKVTKKVMMM